MNDRSDIGPLLGAWFQEGPSVMPDHVIDVVASGIARQPQRRARRLPQWRLSMNFTAKLVAAAAAVVLLVFAGWNVFTGPRSGTGGPGPTATATPDSTPSPTPVPSDPRWPAANGPLGPGSYVTRYAGVEIGLTIPAAATGWDAGGPNFLGVPPFVDPPDGVLLAFNTITVVMRDSCSDFTGVPVGEQVDDLAAVWARLPHAAIDGPTDVKIDSFDAVHVGLTIADDLTECVAESVGLYYIGGTTTARVAGAGQSVDLWIVDVDGTRLVIEASSFPGASDRDVRILQEVVDSVQLDPVP